MSAWYPPYVSVLSAAVWCPLVPPVSSMPVLLILEGQLLSLERRAALLWRADRAGVLVALVVPFLSPDDTRLQLKSLTFVANMVYCLPNDDLYTGALKSISSDAERKCVPPLLWACTLTRRGHACFLRRAVGLVVVAGAC